MELRIEMKLLKTNGIRIKIGIFFQNGNNTAGTVLSQV